MKVTAKLAFGLLLFAALPASAGLTVWMSGDGNTINYDVSGDNPVYECVSVTLDNPTFGGGFCSQPGPGHISGSYTCNYLGSHTVYAREYNSTGQQVYPPQTVDATALPPSFCNLALNNIKFDINADTDDSRVILSNSYVAPFTSTPYFPYPHYQGLLAKDRAIPVDFRVYYNAAPASGVQVDLTIIDPADTSKYLTGNAGDNKGPAPTFKDNCVPCATYTVTSGANGFVETELDFNPATHAGDNYQVVATATYPDGSQKTVTSGTITAWKRIFLEKRQMYRRGGPLATDAPAGVSHIIVRNLPISSHLSKFGNPDDYFAKGDQLTLMHAPAFGQPKSGFYSGTYQVVSNPIDFTASAPKAGPCAKNKPCSVTTNGTTQIIGINTVFTKLNVDDVINISTGAAGVVDSRYVLSIVDNTHLTVHAPTTTSASNLSYTVGDPNLVLTSYHAYTRLALDHALTENYQREPAVNASTGNLTLNDAAVIASSGVFDCPDTLLLGGFGLWSRVFPAAFTEYLLIPTTGSNPLPRMLIDGGPTMQRFADKWFSTPQPTVVVPGSPDPFVSIGYPAASNQQLLFVGDSETGDITMVGSAGLTNPPGTVPNENVSFLELGTVEQRVTNDMTGMYQATPSDVMQKTEVHELIHQWRPNASVFPALGDHCNEMAYDQTGSGSPSGAASYCVMAAPDSMPTVTAPWSSTVQISPAEWQYRNLTTFLHFDSSKNSQSEYVAIRDTPDPWKP
jgi:hypothetical protein